MTTRNPTATLGQRDAYLWGESIGRARYRNGSAVGDAEGTGLRGIERRAYEEGLRQGWANAQSEHVSKQIYTMQQNRRFC